jgi:hypothetical protein
LNALILEALRMPLLEPLPERVDLLQAQGQNNVLDLPANRAAKGDQLRLEDHKVFCRSDTSLGFKPDIPDVSSAHSTPTRRRLAAEVMTSLIEVTRWRQKSTSSRTECQHFALIDSRV